MVKALRAASIPLGVLIVIGTNATSNESLKENLWMGFLAAALLVLAGMLCVGRRWMYFVLPFGFAILLSLYSLAGDHRAAAESLGHPPSAQELYAWLLMKWRNEPSGPYWLSVDILYFIASYVAGWLYGSWSMLVPKAQLPSQEGPTAVTAVVPSPKLIRTPFKIMLFILVGLFVASILFGPR